MGGLRRNEATRRNRLDGLAGLREASTICNLNHCAQQATAMKATALKGLRDRLKPVFGSPQVGKIRNSSLAIRFQVLFEPPSKLERILNHSGRGGPAGNPSLDQFFQERKSGPWPVQRPPSSVRFVTENYTTVGGDWSEVARDLSPAHLSSEKLISSRIHNHLVHSVPDAPPQFWMPLRTGASCV